VDSRLLVIGFGNTLRCDDGAGPRVADLVEELDLAGVLTLACHQITPELAYPVSMAPAVVFVDASVDGSREVRLRALEPCHTSLVLNHAPSPESLLALARDAFGHAPRAWILTVPTEILAYGEDLSPTAHKGIAEAVQRIRDLYRNLPARSQERAASGSGTPTRPQVQVRA